MTWWQADDATDSAKLTLTIAFDLESGGFLVEIHSPALWPSGEPVYSRTVIPVADFDAGLAEQHLGELLQWHVRLLGLD